MSERPLLADLEPSGRTVYLLARERDAESCGCQRPPDPDHGPRFALQAHSLRALARSPDSFVAGYNAVPADVDSAVAREALTTLSSVETE